MTDIPAHAALAARLADDDQPNPPPGGTPGWFVPSQLLHRLVNEHAAVTADRDRLAGQVDTGRAAAAAIHAIALDLTDAVDPIVRGWPTPADWEEAARCLTAAHRLLRP